MTINRGDRLVTSVIIKDGYYIIRQHKENDISCGLDYRSFYLKNGKWKADYPRDIDVESHEYLKKYIPLLNNYVRKQKLAKLLA